MWIVFLECKHLQEKSLNLRLLVLMTTERQVTLWPRGLTEPPSHGVTLPSISRGRIWLHRELHGRIYECASWDKDSSWWDDSSGLRTLPAMNKSFIWMWHLLMFSDHDESRRHSCRWTVHGFTGLNLNLRPSTAGNRSPVPQGLLTAVITPAARLLSALKIARAKWELIQFEDGNVLASCADGVNAEQLSSCKLPTKLTRQQVNRRQRVTAWRALICSHSVAVNLRRHILRCCRWTTLSTYCKLSKRTNW